MWLALNREPILFLTLFCLTTGFVWHRIAGGKRVIFDNILVDAEWLNVRSVIGWRTFPEPSR